ncbi:MAG: hypothetical protein ACE369_15680 [Roseovarius sp.]
MDIYSMPFRISLAGIQVGGLMLEKQLRIMQVLGRATFERQLQFAELAFGMSRSGAGTASALVEPGTTPAAGVKPAGKPIAKPVARKVKKKAAAEPVVRTAKKTAPKAPAKVATANDSKPGAAPSNVTAFPKLDASVPATDAAPKRPRQPSAPPAMPERPVSADKAADS